MSYPYEATRNETIPHAASICGVLALLARIVPVIKKAGAVESGKVMFGDAWFCLNALDFLVEQNYLIEVTKREAVPGQQRIYSAGPNLTPFL